VARTFDKDFEPPYGRVETVSPLIRRVVAENPGPFTFRGTGTYIVGHGRVAVVDPGPDLAAHLDALTEAVRGEEVSHIVVTHTHRDHSPGTAELVRRTGGRVIAFGPHPPDPFPLDEEPEDKEVTTEEPFDLAFDPDDRADDGDVIEGDGWTLQAVHTPGHLPNHLCYALREENALFSGDHIMGWSTTVVAPPVGDMAAYRASLAKIAEREDAVLWPTHGPAVRDPRPFVHMLIEHRHDREQQVLGRLAEGDRKIADIVKALYADVDDKLHKAAGRSVLAHLLELRAEGRVRAEGPIGARAEWIRT
jgi:glyoxylase-like metal-dependent hydrolase (beta-lactamase superfamily II)